MRVEGDYWRDGAVCVRGAFGEGDLRLAEQAIEAVLADPSPLALRASPLDDAAFVEDFCNWQRIPPLRRFIETSPAASIARELIGSQIIRLHHDHVLVKEPGTRQRTPWHQDQPYYNIDGRLNASLWLPVDAVPSEVSLEVVAGSHDGPWYLPRTFLEGHAKWFPEGSLAELPDMDRHAADSTLLRWALEPGDAVYFHMSAVHGAPGAAPSHRRRVLSLRFIGDDVVHAPRPWTTSPPFPGLDEQIEAGSPMDHPLFPVLPTN